MFIAKHLNPKYILRLFKSFEDITPEINFHIQEDGILIRAMDSSRISLINCFVNKNEFDEYKLSEKCILGINLESFCKLMSISENIDTLTLSYKKSGDSLSMIFENDSRKTRFRLKLINLDESLYEIGDINYLTNITMDFSRFISMSNNIEVVLAETVEFNIKPNKVVVKANGELSRVESIWKLDNNKLSTKKPLLTKKLLPNGKFKLVKSKELEFSSELRDETFSASFNMPTIKKIFKISSICDRIKVSFNEDAPLKLKFTTPNDSVLEYYVAPKCD